jgi:hypothetical protein
MPVPQYLCDLRQGTAPAQQIRCECEPKEVGTARRWMKAGAVKGSLDNTSDGRLAVQSIKRRPEADKQAPRRATWPPPTQVRGDRLADVARQRHTLLARTFATNDEFRRLPVWPG